MAVTDQPAPRAEGELVAVGLHERVPEAPGRAHEPDLLPRHHGLQLVQVAPPHRRGLGGPVLRRRRRRGRVEGRDPPRDAPDVTARRVPSRSRDAIVWSSLKRRMTTTQSTTGSWPSSPIRSAPVPSTTGRTPSTTPGASARFTATSASQPARRRSGVDWSTKPKRTGFVSCRPGHRTAASTRRASRAARPARAHPPQAPAQAGADILGHEPEATAAGHETDRPTPERGLRESRTHSAACADGCAGPWPYGEGMSEAGSCPRARRR